MLGEHNKMEKVSPNKIQVRHEVFWLSPTQTPRLLVVCQRDPPALKLEVVPRQLPKCEALVNEHGKSNFAFVSET